MEAIIYIEGEIGVDVQMTDIIQQMKAFPDPSKMIININSVGGYVSHSDEIFDYLNSFDIPKKTIARNFCASAATKLMLLGDEREVEKGTQFMIHNPFAGPEGDADYLKEFSIELKKVENAFVSFYSEKLNQPKIAIAPLMARETFLTEKELLTLGFATAIIEKSGTNKTDANLKAVAKLDLKLNNPNNPKFMKLDQKSKKGLLDRITDVLNSFSTKALLELSDADGNVLMFPELEPEQTPSEGDKVQAEDGSYTVGNQVMTVEDGVVVSVEEISDEGDEDLEQMKKDLDEMSQKYEAEKAMNEEKETKLKEQMKLTAKAKKEIEEIKNLVSDFEIPNKNPSKPKTDEGGRKSAFPTHKKGSIKNQLRK